MCFARAQVFRTKCGSATAPVEAQDQRATNGLNELPLVEGVTVSRPPALTGEYMRASASHVAPVVLGRRLAL
jgi:hypothetical protein